jgi:LysM repeat protein
MLLNKYKKLGMILCGISIVVLSACAQKAPKEEVPAPMPEVSAPLDSTDTMAAAPAAVENTEVPAPVVDVTPATAPVMDEPASVSGSTKGGAGVKYYTVKKGDTVYSIAKKYGTNVKNLMKWNGLKSAKALQVGKKIKVRL